MSLSPETLQLASMLDDQDNDVGLNVLAQLLNREDEVEELSRILQEYPDPLVRKRIHTLQNAFVMRRRRRQIIFGGIEGESAGFEAQGDHFCGGGSLRIPPTIIPTIPPIP